MDVEELRAAGFREAQIVRLLRLRERYLAREVSELTIAAKYLEFVKFLVESNRLHV